MFTLLMLGFGVALSAKGGGSVAGWLFAAAALLLSSAISITGLARTVVLEGSTLRAVTFTGRTVSFGSGEITSFQALGVGAVTQLRVIATGRRSVLLTSRLDRFDELLLAVLDQRPELEVRPPNLAGRLWRFWAGIHLHAVDARGAAALSRRRRQELGEPAAYQPASRPGLAWLALTPSPAGVLFVAVAGYAFWTDGPSPAGIVLLAVGLLAFAVRYAPYRRLARSLQVADDGVTGRDIRGRQIRLRHDEIDRLIATSGRTRAPTRLLIIGRRGERLLVLRTPAFSAAFDRLARRYTLERPRYSDFFPRFDLPL